MRIYLSCYAKRDEDRLRSFLLETDDISFNKTSDDISYMSVGPIFSRNGLHISPETHEQIVESHLQNKPLRIRIDKNNIVEVIDCKL